MFHNGRILPNTPNTSITSGLKLKLRHVAQKSIIGKEFAHVVRVKFQCAGKVRFLPGDLHAEQSLHSIYDTLHVLELYVYRDSMFIIYYHVCT